MNLASRLCDEAAHGEILIDERSAELVGREGIGYALTPGSPLRLKGYREPVPNYLLAVPLLA